MSDYIMTVNTLTPESKIVNHRWHVHLCLISVHLWLKDGAVAEKGILCFNIPVRR